MAQINETSRVVALRRDLEALVAILDPADVERAIGAVTAILERRAAADERGRAA